MIPLFFEDEMSVILDSMPSMFFFVILTRDFLSYSWVSLAKKMNPIEASKPRGPSPMFLGAIPLVVSYDTIFLGCRIWCRFAHLSLPQLASELCLLFLFSSDLPSLSP